MASALIAKRVFASRALDRAGFVRLISAGAVIRLLLALVTTNSNDLRFFATAALNGAAQRPLYADTTFSYPPLWGYIFAGVGKLLAALRIPILVHVRELTDSTMPGLTSADLTTPAASLALKLPALGCDAALAWMLWWAARRFGFGDRAARGAALGWWLNPLVLITTPVQANWDAAVPLAIFGAIVLALEEQFFAAGAVIVAGAAAKLAPASFVFLAPSLLVGAGIPLRRSLRRSLALGLGALVTSLVVLAPIFYWNEIGTMFGAVFARNGTFTTGGTNLLSFSQLQEATRFRVWAEAHRNLVGLGTLALTAGGCSIAAFGLFRKRNRDVRDYALAALVCALTIDCVSPLSQPTYLIWALPFAVFIAATGDRRFWLLVGAITLPTFVFFAAVRAPQALLEPACVFFQLCDPRSYGSQSYAYWIAGGLGRDTIQVTIDAIVGEFAGLGALVGIVMAIGALFAERSGRTVSARPAVATSRTAIFACAAFAFVFVCAGPLIPFPARASISVHSSGAGAAISATGYYGKLTVVATSGAAEVDEIDEYFDARYPSLRGVTPIFAHGFIDHFRDELAARRLNPRLGQLDADALRPYLNAPGSGRMLLVFGGALPDTVRGPHDDRLQRWVRGGGTVVWAGGPFDLIWSQRSRPQDPKQFGGPDYSAWHALYGPSQIFPAIVNIYYPPVTHGSIPTAALDATQMDFERTTYALNSGPLMKLGGRPLAFIDERYNSSVSTLPIGRGTLVFFADAFDDEIGAARTIAQLLFADAWSPRVTIAAAQSDAPASGGLEIGSLLPLAAGDRVAVSGDAPSYLPFATYRLPPPDLHVAAGPAVRATTYSGPLRVLMRNTVAYPPHLYVYADPHYATLPGTRTGLAVSAATLLARDPRLQQTKTTATLADADELGAVLRGEPGNDAVAILGGALPDTVRTRSIDPLKAWIRAGGTIFWAGGPFDTIFATRQALLATSHLSDPDYTMWPEFFGHQKLFEPPPAIDAPARRGTHSSLLRRYWLDPFDATTFGPRRSALEREGGAAIGTFDGRGASSVSVIPIGNGRLVYFGDGFPNPAAASGAIAQLLFTGLDRADPRSLRLLSGSVTPNAPFAVAPIARTDAQIAAFGWNGRPGPFAIGDVARK